MSVATATRDDSRDGKYTQHGTRHGATDGTLFPRWRAFFIDDKPTEKYLLCYTRGLRVCILCLMCAAQNPRYQEY